MSNLQEQRVLIIAEAGVNHNGSLEAAISLVDVAVIANVDIVKFQTFIAEKVMTDYAKKAPYQLKNTNIEESQIEMVKKLQLSLEDHEALVKYCKQSGIEFLSSPFDIESLIFLTKDLNLSKIKIPSGEITNLQMLFLAAKSQKDILLSTGMSTMADVEHALAALAFGYLSPEKNIPSISQIYDVYQTESGQKILSEKVSLLHCTTEYPASVQDVNLNAIATLSAAFGLPVGLSDHTEGIHISLAAVALGAKIIEKHITLDKKMIGPDHAASLEPDELSKMVRYIRDIELSLGDGKKYPRPDELKNLMIARKSIVASRFIKSGTIFSSDDLEIKRPGIGLSPMLWSEVVGKVACRDFEGDELILIG